MPDLFTRRNCTHLRQVITVKWTNVLFGICDGLRGKMKGAADVRLMKY